MKAKKSWENIPDCKKLERHNRWVQSVILAWILLLLKKKKCYWDNWRVFDDGCMEVICVILAAVYWAHCALISHASRVTLKILQARLQQYMNYELPDVQAGFRKGRGNRSNCQHLPDHQKNKRVPERHLFPLYWLRQSLWLCGLPQAVENYERDGNTRPPDLPLEKPVCGSGSNS